MELLRHLVSEVHRRSIWQVLSVYLVGSWGALQVVESVTENAGLPDWVPPFALILLVVGLPVVLATAIVQEGVAGMGGDSENEEAQRSMGTDPRPDRDVAESRLPADGTATGSAADAAVGRYDGPQNPPDEGARNGSIRSRIFTWRNAVAGGVAAFAFLGIAVAGYFVMWSTGIGPVGSLAAQGVFDEGERVVLADFGNATPDTLLGSVVTEALRIDLASSENIRLVETDRVQGVLERMQRDPTETLTPQLAREVAVREGMKAILEGDVGAAGTGYILSATLRGAQSGETLASFRRTAESPEEVIGAIDKLSQDIRQKSGESLRVIKHGAPLEDVTTTSLEALRKFTEADAAFDSGDESTALALLNEAVALDSTFAMAYRKIAVTLSNLGIRREEEVQAMKAAYRHRNRLTERERLITEATYADRITGDVDASIRAYDAVLRIAPNDRAGLNNLANAYMALEQFEKGAELYQRAVSGTGTSNTAFSNLVRAHLLRGDLESARDALAAFREAYPNDPQVQDRAFWLHAWAGEWDQAEAEVAGWEANPGLPYVYRVHAPEYRAQLDAARGMMGDGRAEMAQAQRLAEAELGSASAWFYTLFQAYLEITTGNLDRAHSIISALEERALFDQVPVSARDYGLAAGFHAFLGEGGQVRRYLDRWREELPSDLQGRFADSERALLLARADGPQARPETYLETLNAHRALVRCQRCNRVEEAQALEAVGRLGDARDRWYSAATEMDPNFTVALLNRPHAWEKVGQLSEQLGDTAMAMEGYRQFVEAWADADPELQPRVEAARKRIAALEQG